MAKFYLSDIVCIVVGFGAGAVHTSPSTLSALEVALMSIPVLGSGIEYAGETFTRYSESLSVPRSQQEKAAYHRIEADKGMQAIIQADAMIGVGRGMGITAAAYGVGTAVNHAARLLMR
jgi:hypothetical protein